MAELRQRQFSRILELQRLASLFSRARASILVSALAPILLAQTIADSQPRFDVASVRPNKSGDLAEESHVTTGRLTVRNMVLRNIIKNAYGFRDDAMLKGAPGWVNSERFDITASVEREADKAEVLLMLRALLADRFHLVAHNEATESAVYLLLPAKSGLKVPELKGYKPKPSVAGVQVLTILGPVSGLVTRLTQMMGRPVLDRTGLTGRYDFTLELPVGDDRSSAAVGAQVFGALEEQLGLKLQASKAPLDILVIDHIERPSEN